MSVESLIFIAIFILLPLVERLLKRKRGTGQEPPQAPPPPQPVPRERVPLPPRHGAEIPQASAPDATRRDLPIPRQAPAPRQVPEHRQPSVRQPEPRRPGPPAPVPHQSRLPEPEARPKREGPVRPPPPTQQPARRPAIVVEAHSLESLAGDRAVRTRAAPKAAPEPARQRRTARAVRRIVRNPTSLRRAVLVAALLGPCRANEDM